MGGAYGEWSNQPDLGCQGPALPASHSWASNPQEYLEGRDAKDWS